MKIYISADLEGVNGVMHSSQTQPGEAGYERAVGLMHKELSVIIEAIYSTGSVSEIFVCDAHWDARNLRHEFLPKGVSLITGWQRPFSMMSGVSGMIGSKRIVDKGFDGVFFTGYHARAGVAVGVLSHTYRSQAFLDVRLNGVHVSEAGMNAALSGYFGVPVAFISGDDTACNEARNLLGSITCVPVKKAISRYSAVVLPESEALEALHKGAVEAINKKDYWQVFTPPSPSTITLTMIDPAMADGAELLPEVKRVDDRVVEISHEDFSVLFRLFLAVGVLAVNRKDLYF
jgi:D-amino peptidase